MTGGSCPHLPLLGGTCAACTDDHGKPNSSEFLEFNLGSQATTQGSFPECREPTGNDPDVRYRHECNDPITSPIQVLTLDSPGHPAPKSSAPADCNDPSTSPLQVETGSAYDKNVAAQVTRPEATVVYLLGTRDGALVKVGRTTDLVARLADLRASSPEQLDLLGVLEGPACLERLLHARIDRLRDRTGAAWRGLPCPSEWFRREGIVARVVERVAAGETARDLFAQAEIERAAVEHVVDEPAHMRASMKRISREDAARTLLRLDARAARKSLAEFVKQAWHVLEPGVPLEWSWHHDAICVHVQAMLDDWLACRTDKAHKQRIQDLVLNLCPVSLKSRIIMVFAPAWMWLRCPTWSVACSSGNASNVERDSLACRDLVTSTWYRSTFEVSWSIRADMDRVAKWRTTAGGERISKAMGASWTGIHVDAIFLDDPDDAAKVWGDAARKDVWQAWSSMGNRLNDLKHPVRIVAQQNLHEADLSSRLVNEKRWPRLAIPAEFAPDKRAALVTTTPLLGWSDPRKSVGEALHAARLTPEVIAAERERLGSHGFEAQYNCNPSPLDGGMIARAWWRFFRVQDLDSQARDWTPRPRPTGCAGSGGEAGTVQQHPAEVLKRKRDGRLELDWLAISVDATFGSTSTTASNVGLLCVGGQKQRRFVLDDRTRAMSFLDTVAAIKAMIVAWPAQRVLIELKANGDAVIESLREALAAGEVRDGDGHPITVVVEPIGVEGGKESRAAGMVPAIEAGLVFLLEGAPWLEAFVGEVSSFPNAKRDDRVDALSQLMAYYRASTSSGARARAQNVL